MKLPFSRFVVAGESMEPFFTPGDRVLIRHNCTLQPDDVVVLVRNGVRQLKRITQMGAEGFFVEGDNTSRSTDSRHFGHIPRAAILGKVVLRY